MEELHKLINIIRHKSQRSVQLVNQNFRKKQKSKDNQLYEGILNNIFHMEETASRMLFNTDPGNRNYRNAKAKLKQKLLNHMYFLDYNKSGYTDFMRAKYDCLHTLHQMKILIMEGEDCIALKKLPPLVKTAKKYELIEIALDALLLLRNEFAFMGKCTPLHNSEEEIKQIKPFHRAILECEEIYYDTLVMINKSISSSEKILDEIPGKIKYIKKKAREFRSARLDILAVNLEIANYKLTQNFRGILRMCNYLESKYIKDDVSSIKVDIDHKEVIFLKLYCLYISFETEKGIEYASKRSDIFREGNEDWFRFKEYQFLLCMKAEKFHQATKEFRKVRTNKNYNQLRKKDQSRWTIYRAYILFVNNTKLVRWGFDLEEFLETVPSYPKKLAGYTISTLIIQLLFYLREGNIARVKNKLELLKPLSSQHLDKRHNYRNSIFIRMLEGVVEKEFDYGRVVEKCRNYYHKLEETPLVPDFKQEMEVIPYEMLWEYTLNILKTNKYYIHYRFYNYSEV